MHNVFFIARINNLLEEEKSIVEKCSIFLQEGIPLFNLKIIDPNKFSIEKVLAENSIVISFGNKLNHYVAETIKESNKKILKHVELPSPIYLVNINKNKKDRFEAFKKLKDLKEFLKLLEEPTLNNNRDNDVIKSVMEIFNIKEVIIEPINKENINSNN